MTHVPGSTHSGEDTPTVTRGEVLTTCHTEATFDGVTVVVSVRTTTHDALLAIRKQVETTDVLLLGFLLVVQQQTRNIVFVAKVTLVVEGCLNVDLLVTAG